MSLNGVRAEARDGPPSTGTAATARPSSTRTRRRCTIRTGRVSAGPGDLDAEEEVAVGTSAGLGVAQVGRRKVPTEKTRAPERDSGLSQRPETHIQLWGVICSWTRTPATENFFRTLQKPQKTGQIWGRLPQCPTSLPTAESIMVLIPMEPECSLRILLNTVFWRSAFHQSELAL